MSAHVPVESSRSFHSHFSVQYCARDMGFIGVFLFLSVTLTGEDARTLVSLSDDVA